MPPTAAKSASGTFNATNSRFPNIGEIPEPATLATFGLMGLAGLVIARRRKSQPQLGHHGSEWNSKPSRTPRPS